MAYSRVLLQSVSTPSHGSGVGPPSFGEKATLVYTRVLLSSVSIPSHGSGVGPPHFDE